MPINWNEVNKLKLKYIQQQEADKAQYEKDYLAYLDKKHNQSFLNRFFNPVEKPIKLYNYYTFPLFIDYFYYLSYSNKDVIKFINFLSLPLELRNNIMKYLNLGEKLYYINNCQNAEDFLYINDTEENRKKVSKIVVLIEKYLDEKQKKENAIEEERQKESERQQKEAEAYIDNYINDKEGK